MMCLLHISSSSSSSSSTSVREGRLSSVMLYAVKVVLKRYQIRRASASAHMLCPLPEYSPVFQNTILIVSEDLDGYRSISKGLDNYRLISGCRDKYRLLIQRFIWISDGSIKASLDKSKTRN